MSSAVIFPSPDTSLHRPSTILSPNWRRSIVANEWTDAAFCRSYAPRLHTSSVYTHQPRSTYSVLVVRTPRFTQRPCHYRDWSPGLAPHADLEAAYIAGRLTWDEFAAQYLARLNAFPWLLAEARAKVATLLYRYPSVTFLGLGPLNAPHSSQRVVRSWLLGEPCHL